MHTKTCTEIQGRLNHIGSLIRRFPPSEIAEEAKKQTGALAVCLEELAYNQDNITFRLVEIEKIIEAERKEQQKIEEAKNSEGSVQESTEPK